MGHTVSLKTRLKATFNMPSLRAIIIALITQLSSASAYPDENKPLNSFVNISGDYKKISRVEQLPAVIVDALKSQRKDCSGIGNYGDGYNLGCSVDESKPCKELVSGGNFGDVWFVDYRGGGGDIARTFVAFKLKANKIKSLVAYHHIKKYEFSVAELENQLPEQPNCNEVNLNQEEQIKHIEKVKFGLCIPVKDSFYARFIPK